MRLLLGATDEEGLRLVDINSDIRRPVNNLNGQTASLLIPQEQRMSQITGN